MEAKEQQESRAELELIFLQLINFARFARLGPSEEALRRYIEAATRVEAMDPFAEMDPALWIRVRSRNEVFLKIARAFEVFRASLPMLDDVLEAEKRATDLPALASMVMAR